MTATPSPSAWQRLGHTFRTLGMVNGALYLTDRLLSGLTQGHARLVKYLIVAQPLGRATAAPVRAGTGSVVEEAQPGHPLSAAYPRPASVIAQRFSHGAHCLVASVKAQFAGYLWWQRGHYDEDEVRCRFMLAAPEVSAWDFDVYVEPRYRLGRTLALLWQAAEQRMLQDGLRWTFSRISSFNAESLAAHSRLGAVPVAQGLFLVVGPAQLSLFDRRPFVHLSLHAGACPAIAVAPPSSIPSAAAQR